MTMAPYTVGGALRLKDTTECLYKQEKIYIKSQIMKKCLLHQQTLSLNLPRELTDIVSGRSMYSMAKGSLMENSGFEPERLQALDKLKTSDLPTSLSFSIDRNIGIKRTNYSTN